MSESIWPVRCAWCDALVFKQLRDVNRAESRGAKLYCGKACSGMARRDPNPPSDAERRNAKADYDRKRRVMLGDQLLAEKRAAYHAKVAADPEGVRAKEKADREKNMARHVEYCRRPEYRKWKANYDRQHRARKQFGAFGEAAIILNQLETEILSRASRTEIARANGTLNKHQERKRQYARQTGNPLRR